MTGILQGALSQVSNQRTCVRDHAQMDMQPGIWVSQQVQRLGLLSMNAGNLAHTGKLITMYAYICPECGMVEFVNEGGA